MFQEGGIHVAINEISNLIVVCDPSDRIIKLFNYTGDLVHRFEPCGVDDGLACIPSGIHVLLNGNICVCDTLNHTVSFLSYVSDENYNHTELLKASTRDIYRFG